MPTRWAAGAAWSAPRFWFRAPVSDVRAGYAKVVVLVRVVPAWFDRPSCGMPVVLSLIVCWAWC